jgi:hypothetical protein
VLRFSATGFPAIMSVPLVVVPVTITLPPLGGILTPNILNNASFETGWEGFTNWSGSAAPTGVSRDASGGYAGSTSILRSWTPNPSSDGGAQMLYRLPASDRVWVRFYFRLTAPITSIMKFVRFYDTNFNAAMGGFFIGQGAKILSYGNDQENGAITTWIGLQQNQVIDGNWHSLEIDNWRNGDPSGYPSQAFYYDGVQVSMPDGNDVQYRGAGNISYWSGGRLYSGMRSSSLKLGYIEWLATLNAGNTTTGQINMDRIAVSTAGRIGP